MKLWGRKNSVNVQKVLWCLAELGLEAERVDVGMAYGGLDTAKYLARNPHGRIPTLEDKGLAFWESNTILRYLAGAYGAQRGLYSASDLLQRCFIDRWLDWVLSSLQPAERDLFWGMVRTQPAERDMTVIGNSLEKTTHLWGIVDQHMAGRTYVETDALTIADICLGSYLHRWFAIEGIARPDYVHLARWYERLLQRPAYLEHVAVPLT